MTHDDVLTVFVIIAALALVMQAGILFALFRMAKTAVSAVTRIESGVKEHLNPLLDSVRDIATESRGPVTTILTNLTEVTGTLRHRVASADALAAEAIERARAEMIRADELLTAVMARLERAAEATERGVMAPLREISALLAGVRRGFGYFFARQRQAGEPGSSPQDQLFI